MAENLERINAEQAANFLALLPSSDTAESSSIAATENAHNRILAAHEQVKQNIFETCQRLKNEIREDQKQRDEKYQALEEQHTDLQEQFTKSQKCVEDLKKELADAKSKGRLYEEFFNNVEALVEATAPLFAERPVNDEIRLSREDEIKVAGLRKDFEMCRLQLQKVGKVVEQVLDGNAKAGIDKGVQTEAEAAATEMGNAVEGEAMENKKPEEGKSHDLEKRSSAEITTDDVDVGDDVMVMMSAIKRARLD